MIEKAAYIKGLCDGLELDNSTKEGKMILALVGLVEEMAETIDEMQAKMSELEDYCEELDEDLGDVEEVLLDLDDEDYDDCDGDCDNCCCDCDLDDDDEDEDEEYFEIDGEGYDMADECSVWQLNNAGTKVSAGKLAKKNVVVILDSEGDATEIFQYKGEVLGL